VVLRVRDLAQARLRFRKYGKFGTPGSLPCCAPRVTQALTAHQSSGNASSAQSTTAEVLVSPDRSRRSLPESHNFNVHRALVPDSGRSGNQNLKLLFTAWQFAL
jgi:hypothetical protein